VYGHTISILAQIYNIFLNCANAQLFFCTKNEKKEKKREKVRKIRKNRAINEKKLRLNFGIREIIAIFANGYGQLQ